MSQEVMIAGAVFSDVPSIRVPDSNNVFHSFTDVTDTTATASDVASGKYFYAADGTRTAGTSSGGGGGGASNLVTGTFTTGDTAGAATVTIPYTGSGYPIAAIVVVEGGAYNPDVSGWYDLVARYNVGFWVYTKADTTSTPTYGTSGSQNAGMVMARYKSSASTSTTLSQAGTNGANTLSSDDGGSSSTGCIRFKSATTMSYYTADPSSYGLTKSLTYRYFIAYSE